MTAPFSAELRAATWSDHARAEHTDYLDALMAGRLGRAEYADMVAQHYFAYVVLEDAANVMGIDPVAGPFVVEGLRRIPALEADLAFLLGDRWREAIAPNAATVRYVDRLRAVCFDWAGGFVAHHYTRYLGDLSGGQHISRSVARNLGLTGGDGTSFYDFAGLGDLKEFKAGYRDLLDAAGWDAAERGRVVAETAVAYQLNTDVLAELGRDLVR